MSEGRKQLEQLQKPNKRPRIPTVEEDSILAEEQAVAHQAEEEQAADEQEDTDDEEENREPVQFERGTTQQGALCLWYKGYRFIHRDRNFFRCAQKKSCKATAILDDKEQLLGRLGLKEHSHEPVLARQKALDARAQIKQRVMENPRTKPSHIRAEIRTDKSDDVFEQMGTNEAIDRNIRRTKNRALGNVNRADPLQIQIPLELLNKNRTSTDAAPHLRPDICGPTLAASHLRPDICGPTPTASTFVLLDILKRNRRWSMDGTFCSAPSQWKQVFIVGCYVNNRMVICCQFLLPGKRTKYYNEALQAVQRALNPAQPARVIMDFEQSMLKAARQIFPGCQQSMCNFHLGQALFRKARKMGIFNLFDGQDNAAKAQQKAVYKTFRSVLSLALVPLKHIRLAFLHIINNAPEGMGGWLSYFAKNYIGLTQFEHRLGANAFTPEADTGRLLLRRTRNNTPRTEATFAPTSITNMSVTEALLASTFIANTSVEFSQPSRQSSITSIGLLHRNNIIPDASSSMSAANTTLQFGQPSPQPSTPSFECSSVQVVQRWDQDIVRPPRFAAAF